MFDITATYTDQYELVMGQAYFLADRKDHQAVFDYFYRKTPFNGGYAVFAGLLDLLTILENLRFDQKDLDFLQAQNFDSRYLTYLILKISVLPARFILCRKGIWYFPQARF